MPGTPEQKRPLVSILMPAYNHERYVGEAIRSVLAQSYPNIELIVVNDGSTDATRNEIGRLAPECSSRLKRFVLVDQANQGARHAVGQALGLARGEFVVPFSSDDRLTSSQVEILVSAASRAPSGTGMVFGDATFIDDSGHPIALEDSEGRPRESFIDYHLSGQKAAVAHQNRGSYASLLRGNYIPGQSALISRADLLAVDGWDSEYIIEDWALWLKMARTTRLLYVDNRLAEYRWHTMNTVKQQRGLLLIDAGRVLVREMEYCMTNAALTRVWHESFARWFLGLLRHRDYSVALNLAAGVNKRRLAVQILRLVVSKLSRQAYKRA